ncbi:MAG: hypothetical protein QME58_07545 [Bacteroidota bacterium]|nr:hypothetical protein [Bacteroidota bacterium]
MGGFVAGAVLLFIFKRR